MFSKDFDLIKIKFRGFFISFVFSQIFFKIHRFTKMAIYVILIERKIDFNVLLAKMKKFSLAYYLSIFQKFQNIFAYLCPSKHCQQKFLSKTQKKISRIFKTFSHTSTMDTICFNHDLISRDIGKLI